MRRIHKTVFADQEPSENDKFLELGLARLSESDWSLESQYDVDDPVGCTEIYEHAISLVKNIAEQITPERKFSALWSVIDAIELSRKFAREDDAFDTIDKVYSMIYVLSEAYKKSKTNMRLYS
eukprot:CAMPEP_0176343438 /NCGR_PEP_ID=MMETSP0126-20121128/3940_1 /TAXON_ID=141414 ORGANISM="Strombidinopsis acuminatum, Strain SPMC142" /NCGR_SAMPLE_ID=MMETSP0126 /ASSEMBLY_ACC=CAM_ASM_000229 /LENGTH=122 /DNA_ID=CAMNT_0017689379 /DNA_START=1055 /DNA_END=1423 /DNA_ORIENTATION=-